MIKGTFDQFDEQDLSIVILQVAKRMLELRIHTPDIGFWYSVLFKTSKFLSSFPVLNDEEKLLACDNDARSLIKATRKLQDRTNMRLRPAYDIVKEWVFKNADRLKKD